MEGRSCFLPVFVTGQAYFLICFQYQAEDGPWRVETCWLTYYCYKVVFWRLLICFYSQFHLEVNNGIGGTTHVFVMPLACCGGTENRVSCVWYAREFKASTTVASKSTPMCLWNTSTLQDSAGVIITPLQCNTIGLTDNFDIPNCLKLTKPTCRGMYLYLSKGERGTGSA